MTLTTISYWARFGPLTLKSRRSRQPQAGAVGITVEKRQSRRAVEQRVKTKAGAAVFLSQFRRDPCLDAVGDRRVVDLDPPGDFPVTAAAQRILADLADIVFSSRGRMLRDEGFSPLLRQRRFSAFDPEGVLDDGAERCAFGCRCQQAAQGFSAVPVRSRRPLVAMPAI